MIVIVDDDDQKEAHRHGSAGHRINSGKTHKPSCWEAPYGRMHLFCFSQNHAQSLHKTRHSKNALDVSEFSLVHDHT